MKTLKISLISLFFNSIVFGQNINYFGIFPTLDHSAKFANKWSYNSYLFSALKPYNHENQFGVKDEARMLYNYLELGITYNITKNLSFTSSYVFEKQNPNRSFSRNENRLFQQITWNIHDRKFTLKQRLRFDERFIQDPISKETNFSHRLRFLLGGSYDISDKIYLFGYSEFFFNTTKGAQFKFNENWSALQLGYKFNKKNHIQFGLLYVGWIYNQSNDWFHQHYLQTTWVSKLDFRKWNITKVTPVK
jgi:long-subunit fatty acid transport protein